MLDGRRFPIIDDVIVLIHPAQYPPSVRTRLQVSEAKIGQPTAFAPDIQETFGREWQDFPDIMEEHRQEFHQYFDVVDVQRLNGLRICDMGCGIGRWSHFLQGNVREIILVDFSDAIFVARRNLRASNNAFFFMADLTDLPFRHDFADLIFCLGVLHHLETNALSELRSLAKFSPQILAYLYTALDERPAYHRTLLAGVTMVRRNVSRIKNSLFRSGFSWAVAILVYRPLIILGILLRPFGVSNNIPLYQFYVGKSLKRIRQDVYDRFFTRIEQRFTRREIMTLSDTFQGVTISDQLPTWHFLCER